MNWFYDIFEQGKYLAVTVAALATLGPIVALIGVCAATALPRPPRATGTIRTTGMVLLAALCALGLVVRYGAPEQLDGAPFGPTLVLAVMLVFLAWWKLMQAQHDSAVWSRARAALRARRPGAVLKLLHLTAPGVVLAGLATALGGALVASNLAGFGDGLAVFAGVALAAVVLALLRGSARSWRWIAFAAVVLSAFVAVGLIDISVLLALAA